LQDEIIEKWGVLREMSPHARDAIPIPSSMAYIHILFWFLENQIIS